MQPSDGVRLCRVWRTCDVHSTSDWWGNTTELPTCCDRHLQRCGELPFFLHLEPVKMGKIKMQHCIACVLGGLQQSKPCSRPPTPQYHRQNRNVMSGAGNARVSGRHWIERRDIDSVFKQTLTLRVRGARPFPPSGSCRTTGGGVFPAVCFLRHLWANELKLQQSSSRAAGCSLSSSDVTQIAGKLKAVVLLFSLVE